MIRQVVFKFWLMASVILASGPLMAQADPPAAERAAAAMGRLDFRTALTTLGRAIAASPQDPGLRLARAALHARMNRPALALDDLTTVLAADPANHAARQARGALHLALGAFARAANDFDVILETTPDDIAALLGRARARSELGLEALAEADYDTAFAIAPDTPGLAEARADLAAPSPSLTRYDPAMLMNPAFRVQEGSPDAPHTLVQVHAGNDLAGEGALLPRAALDPAVAAGTLSVIHLFTFTGQDSAIWANLALICAEPAGFAKTWDALASAEARHALDAIDAGRGRGAFEAIVTAAYAQAGLAPAQATDCAFNRGQALAYLANWTDTREANAWQGASIYDSWPVFVLDGIPVGAAGLRKTLVTLTPPPPQAPRKALPDPAEAAPAPPAVEGGARVAASPGGDATPAPRPSAPLPLPADFGPIDEDARIPGVLKGVWAPSLAECIAYTDAIATPATLDTALPGLNPLDGDPLGTVLLTSRRMLLFNAVETACTLVSITAGDRDASPWTAQLACRNAAAPDVTVPMALTRVADAGPAPRLLVDFGANTGLDLLQCRPLGRLGRDFASLWQIEADGCTATAPAHGARFTFAAADGLLTLAVSPQQGLEADETRALRVSLDGTPLAEGAQAQGPVWQVDLGPVETASERLAFGLLLDATLVGPRGTASWARLLPLLGSSQAMSALTACARG